MYWSELLLIKNEVRGGEVFQTAAADAFGARFFFRCHGKCMTWLMLVIIRNAEELHCQAIFNAD